MRKILASLFVIVAVVGIGVYATGAYFTDTVTQTNLTFNTGTAALKFGFCPGLAQDCSGVDPTLHDLATWPSQTIGPGINNADCLVLKNTGSHPLDLTGGISWYTQSATGMDGVFRVKAETSNPGCNPGTGSVIFGTQKLVDAYNAGPQVFGSLAPGAKMYVIWSNDWDSTGNQNGLQSKTITVDTFMTGQTP